MFICLTGPIASGKSALSAMLAERGFTIVDADAISRELTSQGGALVPVIAEAFPGVVTDGVLDRAKLASQVFGNDEARQKLNGIMHPAIRAEMDRQSDAAEGIAVSDIPLIIETGRGAEPAILIAVMADGGTRLKRLVDERGMSEDDARARMATQASDEARRIFADILIDNNGDLADLERRATWLAGRLRETRAAWDGADIDGVAGSRRDAVRLARKIRYHGGFCDVVDRGVLVWDTDRAVLRSAGCVDRDGWMSANVEGRIMVEIVGRPDKLHG